MANMNTIARAILGKSGGGGGENTVRVLVVDSQQKDGISALLSAGLVAVYPKAYDDSADDEPYVVETVEAVAVTDTWDDLDCLALDMPAGSVLTLYLKNPSTTVSTVIPRGGGLSSNDTQDLVEIIDTRCGNGTNKGLFAVPMQVEGMTAVIDVAYEGRPS